MELEIIYTVTDELQKSPQPRSYGNLHISHDSFVAVDYSPLPEWK